jgi:uncharacterized protein YkwD
LRKVAAAALAVPILALFYVPLLARRPVAARIGLVAGVGIVVIAAGFGLARPVTTTATQPAPPITALAADAFSSIGAGTDLHAAIEIRFSEPMDPRSVAASLTVLPATSVDIAWNATRTVLTVRPTGHWEAGRYHTITIAAGTLAAGGRPMSTAVRAAFVTRAVTSGRVAATRAAGNATSISTAFRITFDRPVALDALEAALRVAPAVEGTLVADTMGADDEVTAALAFTFTPAANLAPATRYRVSVGALLDGDGSAVAAIAPLAIRTSNAPAVVRFRPASSTSDVSRRAALSVRFSEPMTHLTTKTAFTVSIDGKPVAGTVRFAESSTVLIFQPSSPLPENARVVMTVATTATSVNGVPLAQAATSAFRTHAPALAAPRSSTPSTTTTRTYSGGSGGAVGGGSWGAVETYYLRLMNCTRTGGWVTSTGSCSSPGGRSVAPLRLDAGISSRVSRPYAKKLAVNNLCTHFSGGNPGDRLRAAGYTSYRWAENLGCRSGNPYSAVLGSHLFFQSERSYNGGHYVNLMNSAYDRCGIGVWVSGGRVRLVIDFYHPL